jgi:hypothetical protein
MAINDMLAMNKELKSPELKQVSVSISEVENEEEGLLSDMAPKGEWSMEAMNIFLESLNKVAALFSLPAFDKVKEVVTVIPTPTVKALIMIQDAVGDAVEQDVVSPDLAFDVSALTNDNDLGLLGGKLDLLARDKELRRFLKESPETGEAQAEPEDNTSPEPVDDDAFLAARI